MKITQTLILIFLCSWCWGQDLGNSIDEWIVKDGNGSTSNGLMIVYNGDIPKLIERLKKDLGKTEVILDNQTNRRIVFTKIVKPEWSDSKLKLTFMSISNRERHIITVTCRDQKKFDCLVPKTELQKKIKEYFKAVIDES